MNSLPRASPCVVGENEERNALAPVCSSQSFARAGRGLSYGVLVLPAYGSPRKLDLVLASLETRSMLVINSLPSRARGLEILGDLFAPIAKKMRIDLKHFGLFLHPPIFSFSPLPLRSRLVAPAESSIPPQKKWGDFESRRKLSLKGRRPTSSAFLCFEAQIP